MNVAAWLQKNGRSYATRPGISVGRRVHLTLGDWALRVRRIAQYLREDCGCLPGDRVALMSKTRYEWTLTDVAIWFAGGVIGLPLPSLQNAASPVPSMKWLAPVPPWND